VKNVGEAYKLIEVGFEYSTGEYRDSGKIFRKRKQRISRGLEKSTY
jgi:hypothetical protein